MTKLAVFRWMLGLLHPADPLLLYGCGGLPSTTVCGHMHATQSAFKVPAYFLGDLDPGDLTVLLALASGNPRLRSDREGTSLRYLGIGVRFLELFRRRLTAAQLKTAELDMTPDELHHFRLIRDIFLNVEDVIGEDSLRLLERGKKLEVEGLLRWASEGTKLRADLRAFLLRQS